MNSIYTQIQPGVLGAYPVRLPKSRSPCAPVLGGDLGEGEVHGSLQLGVFRPKAQLSSS